MNYDDELENDDIDMDAWIAENLPGKLDIEKVPPQFRSLIPLAETWGINDDVARGEALDRASTPTLRELVETVSPYHAAFDEWLAGPQSYLIPLSREYIAFTCLRLASDAAKIRINRRKNNV